MCRYYYYLRHRPETSVLESTVLGLKSTEVNLQFLVRLLAKYTLVYSVDVSDSYKAPIFSNPILRVWLEPIYTSGGFGNLNSGREWILSF